MKRVFLLIFAIIPLAAALVVLQSCGGQGGPLAGGTNPVSPTAAFLALLPVSQANASVTYVGNDTCLKCHNDPTNVAAYNKDLAGYASTKHSANNVSCERCHGPGSAHAANPGTALTQADPTTANILTLPNGAAAEVCAQCHGPIYDQWKGSKHAEMVEAGNPATPATNISSSRCSLCHSAVARVASLDSLTYSGTSNDGFSTITQAQANLWAGFDSHGVFTDGPTVKTATCVTCHNPHKQTGNLDQDGEDHQLRHATFNLDQAAGTFGNGTLIGGYGANTGPNSTAASFQSLDQGCAECHNGRGVTPTDAKLRTGTSRPSMHDSPQFNMLMGFGGVEGTNGGPPVRNMGHSSAPGQCSHCHMSGGDHSFTVHYDTACTPCHSGSDAANRATSVKDDITNKLYALRQSMSRWSLGQTWHSLPGGPNGWDYTSNIPVGENTPTDQTDTTVPINVKRARHNYYFILRDESTGVHNYPYADFLITEATNEMSGVSPHARPLADNLTTAQKRAVLMADLQRMRQSERQNPE